MWKQQALISTKFQVQKFLKNMGGLISEGKNLDTTIRRPLYWPEINMLVKNVTKTKRA